jgi:hypothetical protein
MARFALVLSLALCALVPAAAAAAGPQPPNCALYAPRPSAEHPMTLPSGEKVVARDPYGGLLPRNRLFFDFSVVKVGGGAPTGVAQVTWALDGKVVRTDPTTPFEWKGVSGSDRRMPAGDHQITVTVMPAGGGAPVSATFALTATDCQPAGTFANPDAPLGRGVHGSQLEAWSALESDTGPTMRAVTFQATDVTARIPASARGRSAGTLKTDTGRTYQLRVPRSGTTLLRRGALRVVLHPGARRYLTVSGLPGGVRDVALRLVGRGGGRLLVAHGSRLDTSAVVVSPAGTVRVRG